jgi:predicted amidohydrolase YtcJ
MFRILISAVIGLLCGCAARAQPFDLLLTNGKVVDGMGNPWYRASVGIRAGRIAAIGALKGQQAARIVDVHGQIIAPGFIDMMGGSSSPNRQADKANSGRASRQCSRERAVRRPRAAAMNPR